MSEEDLSLIPRAVEINGNASAENRDGVSPDLEIPFNAPNNLELVKISSKEESGAFPDRTESSPVDLGNDGTNGTADFGPTELSSPTEMVDSILSQVQSSGLDLEEGVSPPFSRNFPQQINDLKNNAQNVITQAQNAAQEKAGNLQEKAFELKENLAEEAEKLGATAQEASDSIASDAHSIADKISHDIEDRRKSLAEQEQEQIRHASALLHDVQCTSEDIMKQSEQEIKSAIDKGSEDFRSKAPALPDSPDEIQSNIEGIISQEARKLTEEFGPKDNFDLEDFSGHVPDTAPTYPQQLEANLPSPTEAASLLAGAVQVSEQAEFTPNAPATPIVAGVGSGGDLVISGVTTATAESPASSSPTKELNADISQEGNSFISGISKEIMPPNYPPPKPEIPEEIKEVMPPNYPPPREEIQRMKEEIRETIAGEIEKCPVPQLPTFPTADLKFSPPQSPSSTKKADLQLSGVTAGGDLLISGVTAPAADSAIIESPSAATKGLIAEITEKGKSLVSELSKEVMPPNYPPPKPETPTEVKEVMPPNYPPPREEIQRMREEIRETIAGDVQVCPAPELPTRSTEVLKLSPPQSPSSTNNADLQLSGVTAGGDLLISGVTSKSGDPVKIESPSSPAKELVSGVTESALTFGLSQEVLPPNYPPASPPKSPQATIENIAVCPPAPELPSLPTATTELKFSPPASPSSTTNSDLQISGLTSEGSALISGVTRTPAETVDVPSAAEISAPGVDAVITPPEVPTEDFPPPPEVQAPSLPEQPQSLADQISDQTQQQIGVILNGTGVSPVVESIQDQIPSSPAIQDTISSQIPNGLPSAVEESLADFSQSASQQVDHVIDDVRADLLTSLGSPGEAQAPLESPLSDLSAAASADSPSIITMIDKDLLLKQKEEANKEGAGTVKVLEVDIAPTPDQERKPQIFQTQIHPSLDLPNPTNEIPKEITAAAPATPRRPQTPPNLIQQAANQASKAVESSDLPKEIKPVIQANIPFAQTKSEVPPPKPPRVSQDSAPLDLPEKSISPSPVEPQLPSIPKAAAPVKPGPGSPKKVAPPVPPRSPTKPVQPDFPPTTQAPAPPATQAPEPLAREPEPQVIVGEPKLQHEDVPLTDDKDEEHPPGSAASSPSRGKWRRLRQMCDIL